MQTSNWTDRYQMAGPAPRGDALESYRAVTTDGRRVIIKVTRPRDPEWFLRFIARLGQVQHPNVARVVDWGQDGERCWVATEAFDGLDLQSVLSTEHRLPPEAAASMGQQTASGLEALHAAGIVHGGVAPHTVVRTFDGTVKLIDVGLRAALAPIDMGRTAPAAAAWCASPEEVMGQPLVPASDQYALGLMLYELCTGRRAFDGPDAFTVADMQVRAMPAAPRTLASDLPPSLEGVLWTSMQKRPEQRYPSMADMRRDLEGIVGGAHVPIAPVPVPPEPKKRRTLIIVGIVLLALLAAVLAAWALGAFGGGATVPDVSGQPLSQAKATLTGAGLVVGSVKYEGGTSAATPDVAVVAQSPKAGSKVDEGAVVNLTLGSDLATVPSVVGMTEAAAVNALNGAGLKLDRVQQQQSATVASGLVIEQAPQAGSNVPRGSAYTLIVSKGAGATTVPNVEGDTQAAAEKAITAAGYVAKVVQQASSSVPAGMVISQNPSPGVQAAKGSQVTIVVSTGASSSPSPTSSGTPTSSPSP